jgi:hypothetical protein
MTAFILKLIALTTMVIDHLGAVFPDTFLFAFRIIGRIAFPLYVYLIAEGCRHTRSMPKFLLRLAAFALISEIPFDLSIHGGPVNFLYETNIFYTLTFGALAIYAYQYLRERRPSYALYLSVGPLIALMWLADWMHTDYGAIGVAFIFTMYVIPHKKLRLAVMAIFCCLFQLEIIIGVFAWLFNIDTIFTILVVPEYVAMPIVCLLTVPLAAFYSGKRGPSLKWFFYFSYPVHLAVFAAIKMILLN